MIVTFFDLKSLRTSDTEGIMTSEKGPKSFWTFEKRAPGLLQSEIYVRLRLT